MTRDITLLSQVCDIDRFTVPIREEPVRFLGGVVEDMQHDFRETSTSLSNPRKRSGVEMRVSGELFRQLASYCAYSKEGQVLVKIKVGDIHVEWDRGKDNFCGRSRDEDACSGMNLATDCNTLYVSYRCNNNIYSYVIMINKVVLHVHW